MAIIKNNLRVLIARWEVENNQKLSLESLAKRVNVSKQTLVRYTNGKSTRVDLRVCASLLEWFHEQGFYVTMADLFKIEYEGAKHGA